MIVGIVGSSKAVESQCLPYVKALIDNLPDNTIFATGDAVGVDSWVATYARIKKRPLTQFFSKNAQWEPDGYKERNMAIANYCDKIFSLALPLNNEVPCYHCAGVSAQVIDHQKTAGCWTGLQNGNYKVVVMHMQHLNKN